MTGAPRSPPSTRRVTRTVQRVVVDVRSPSVYPSVVIISDAPADDEDALGRDGHKYSVQTLSPKCWYRLAL